MSVETGEKRPGVRDADEIMGVLRSRGMSYPAISSACDVLLGWKLTEEHVRQRLLGLGFPKNPAKARAPRRGPGS